MQALLSRNSGAIIGVLRGVVPVGLKDRLPRPIKRLAKAYLEAHLKPINGMALRLWGGFARSATDALNRMAADETVALDERVRVKEILAYWLAADGDMAGALRELEAGYGIAGVERERGRTPAHIQLLNLNGRGGEAREMLNRRVRGVHELGHTLLLANSWTAVAGGAEADPVKQLSLINQLYAHVGLAEIALRDGSRPLSLDNIVGSKPAGTKGGSLVTIIVPAYNSPDTIGTALASLAAQTWQDIEVLVVDDASTDHTTDVVEAFAATDKRFRLIRQTENSGSYVGRNRALSEARGKYVTIHDSDDWAHPERIALHVEDMERLKHPFSVSRWGRVTPDLLFQGIWKPAGLYLTHLNLGSFFFERQIVDRIGNWSAVRVSADREFHKRAEMVYGPPPDDNIGKRLPLVLGRSSPDSLTQTKATHVSTTYHGVRKVYHDGTDYWHATHRAGQLPIADLQARISTVAPHIIRPQRIVPQFDLMLIADWNMRGGAVQSARNLAQAALAIGKSVCVLHYPRYESEMSKPLHRSIRQVLDKLNITTIAPGEPVKVDTVVVTYPAIFDHFLDRFPKVEHRRLVVLINQMAERDDQRKSVAYDIERVKAHLTESLGSAGEWTPISNWVLNVMKADPRYPRPAANPWIPLIDSAGWLDRKAEWRGGGRREPHVGRHGRDHPLKWLGNAEALRAAYCADKPCKVLILGGAEAARETLGRYPRNWRVKPFGAEDVQTFLADLDFFVHYPHETYIEEFGRAPMEAMAMGVPVLLPEIFRQTFGDAALYVAPEDVWPTIERLWGDERAWLARVEAGRRFVIDNCSYDVLRQRLAQPAPAATN